MSQKEPWDDPHGYVHGGVNLFWGAVSLILIIGGSIALIMGVK